MRCLISIVVLCALAVSPWTTVSRAQDSACEDRCPGGVCLRVDQRPIARIAHSRGSARNLGTGTLVDVYDGRALVVTCAHLFRDGDGETVVTFADGRAFTATVLKLDEQADLAALEIKAPQVQPVELAQNFPQPGDALVSCGYGSDGRLWCNRGQALGYVTTVGGHSRETLELSGAARLGDSGGPVLDRQGRMVAVLFGTNGRVVDGTFCGRIRQFLSGLSPRFGKTQPATPPVTQPPVTPPTQTPDPSTGPLVNVPPRPVVVQPPDAKRDEPGPLERMAEPWLAAKVTALLVSFGLPAGVATVVGGAIVWFLMRRGKQKLAAELERLKARRGTPDNAEATGDESPAVLERHHNRYVPYEISLLDKAWATAHARVGEKYPGAVPYLKIVEGVKDQLLSGVDEPQVS